MRTDAELELRRKWKERLERPEVSGRRTVNAILPCMEAWLNRIHGQCSFRLTKIISGYGSFAAFLHRIGKLGKNQCLECNLNIIDDADHALSNCSM